MYRTNCRIHRERRALGDKESDRLNEKVWEAEEL